MLNFCDTELLMNLRLLYHYPRLHYNRVASCYHHVSNNWWSMQLVCSSDVIKIATFLKTRQWWEICDWLRIAPFKYQANLRGEKWQKLEYGSMEGVKWSLRRGYWKDIERLILVNTNGLVYEMKDLTKHSGGKWKHCKFQFGTAISLFMTINVMYSQNTHE